MTEQPTCTAQLRASEGPCETCDDGEAWEAWEAWEAHDSMFALLGQLLMLGQVHPYLGSLLGVCGHVRSEHKAAGKAPEGLVNPPTCAACFVQYGQQSAVLHAFTTEPEPEEE